MHNVDAGLSLSLSLPREDEGSVETKGLAKVRSVISESGDARLDGVRQEKKQIAPKLRKVDHHGAYYWIRSIPNIPLCYLLSLLLASLILATLTLKSSPVPPPDPDRRKEGEMSKPWGGAGAWALEAERAEAEDREGAAASNLSSGGTTFLAGDPAQSFPSLKDANTKPKKKKGVSLTLSEFNTGAYVGPGGAARRDPVFEPKGLTHDEMLRLPTGPRERTAEELERSRLGGGFRSYGYGHGGGDGAAPPRRRYDLGMDDEPRRGAPGPRTSDLDQFSRADEVENWAATKKSFTPTMDSSRQERYGSLGSGGSSKADEVDSWSSGKKSIAPPSKYSSLGSGFRDSLGSGPVSDRWVRGSDSGSLPSNGERERPRLVLDPPKGDSGLQPEIGRSRPSPFGAARPREEVLAEKGLDWRKMETVVDIKKNTRPTSSQSSRPSSAHSSRPGSPVSQVSGEGGAPKPRTKANPFGDAKPREVLLEEKGMDWRKIDQELDHRRVDRPETDEEKMLKEEIDDLKKELVKETENKPDYDFTGNFAEPIKALHEQIRHREKELDQLIRKLNDKVRFGQRASTDVRPGSGAGRIPLSPDRPLSHSGMSEDSIHMEFKERPRSRGTAESWDRPMDDRRGFNSGRDLGFLAGGNVDR
ncbi:hypothetical protein AXF42_Ash006693 [Apostasia shenzhenica]|uniref:Eukaryotic translation initiation factor 4B1 n=1 Tax=Apostasia shenzhenica TaxID=1088818 RepID=A0A2I0AIY1_9ASPA|nr:hypothetical protein AXF42_Ash006693 [Apostasia shenzhenica]